MATGGVRADTRSWLSRALALSQDPLPWLEATRAAIGLGVVIAVAMALGRPDAGLLAAAGMVQGVMRPDVGPYRSRVLGLLVSQLAGAAGLVMGQLVHGHGWWTVAMITLVALFSGLISSVGKVLSGAALSLLFMNVLGAGLHPVGELWLPPLLQLAGGVFYILLALLSWRIAGSGADPQRKAVAAVYAGIADLLDASPHPGEARRALSRATDGAQDALLRHQLRGEGSWDTETRWLVGMLNAATPLAEETTVLIRSGRTAPPGLAETVRRIAEAVRTGRKDADIAPFEGDPAFARSIGYILRRLPSTELEGPDWLGLPEPLPTRAREAARLALTSGAAWRYGLRLALCMAIASVITEVPGVPHLLGIPQAHSFWVSLTVVVVLKPDFGSVFVRSLLRALGTIAAAVPTLLVLVAVPRGWAAVPLAAFFGGLIPLLKVKSYAMRTAAVTPLMLFLLDMISPAPSGELVAARLADTVLGSLIVLVFGYALWPESWRIRLGDRITAGFEAAADYLDEAFTGSWDVRARDRRALHRSLNSIQNGLRQSLSEPPPASRQGGAWWPVLIELDHLVDAVTAASVQVREGAEPPPEPEVRAVSAELREMAMAIHEGRKPAVRAAAAPSEDVLDDVAAQTRSLRGSLPL
ncbi:FUSC family protein [Actinocorallia populi]|uniref:FUSC family protein n=1 Tax=Actinocorallia populi TaxID=2079200 RepID=UPI000D08EBC9|nr:FUSC family protein [Actinocorallia populi]